MNLKPGDLVLVKADTFKGKRKIKNEWEDKACEVVYQIATDVSSYKVTTNADSHTSSTETNFYLSCQRLAFPCLWVSAMHRMNVPAPPQLSQLLTGVMIGLHHE